MIKGEKRILGGDRKNCGEESTPEELAGCLGIAVNALLQDYQASIVINRHLLPSNTGSPTPAFLDPCDFHSSRLISCSSSSSHSLHSSDQRAPRQPAMLRLSSSASARVIGFSSRSAPSRHQHHSLKLQQTRYQQQVSIHISQ